MVIVDIFECIFVNENVWIVIKISLKFVSKGPMNNIPVLVQIMAWRRPGDKPLSEPWLPRHICITPLSELISEVIGGSLSVHLSRVRHIQYTVHWDPDSLLGLAMRRHQAITQSSQMNFSAPYFFCLKLAVIMLTTWYPYFQYLVSFCHNELKSCKTHSTKFHLRRVSDLLYDWKSCLLCYMKDVYYMVPYSLSEIKIVRVRIKFIMGIF